MGVGLGVSGQEALVPSTYSPEWSPSHAGGCRAPDSWPRACLPSGDVSIGIKCAPGVVGPAEADIDFDIIKNDNDTFTVKYTPPGAGRYTIMVLFANQVPCAWVLVINPNLSPLPHPNQQLERLSFGDNSTAPD